MSVITLQTRHLIDMYLDIEGLRQQKDRYAFSRRYQQYISETP
jgi:hypothetical protein